MFDKHDKDAKQQNASTASAPPSSLLYGSWLNEPKIHRSLSETTLEILTDEQTDFWRETHYGFTHDSGHFLGVEAPSNFTCQLRIRGTFEALYDQAGIMVGSTSGNGSRPGSS